MKQYPQKQSRQIKPFDVASDLLAGTIVGVFSGLYLDKFFETKPLLTIVCSIFGMLAAFRMIYGRIK